VIVDALSAVYGAAATWRREWYARRPARARRLTQPVISVGNLRVGGAGKTPVVACIARLLLESGERPVILSRGYARQKSSGAVTVVSTRDAVIADVAHAGDEPLLLARTLPGVPVLVCADRFMAGRHAEAEFDATVHLLDDGFQHVRLARDIDLLMADEHDLDDRVLPAGRLREPLGNAGAAHAVIVPGAGPDTARKVAERLGIRDVFRSTRALGTPVMLHPPGGGFDPSAAVFAVAGIARPHRFFDDARAAGLRVVGTLAFRDHHQFDGADVARMVSAARAGGADAIITTEKDAMRLEGLDLSSMPFAAVPLLTRVEPSHPFAVWLAGRLAGVRAGCHHGRT
jgi:tetraacyldisaccharide 4'-kinase